MELLVLDGNNLSHISFHKAKSILKKDGVTSLDRIELMTYHLFFLKLFKIFKVFKDHIKIICWDEGGKSVDGFSSINWRKTIYPQYKQHRKYHEDDSFKALFNAISNIKEVLENFPLYQLSKEGVEGDDLIFACVKKITNSNTVIVSTDSDLLQIPQRFKNVKLLNPITLKYVNPPNDYNICDFKAIKGDKSDDIEGIYGYGDKKSLILAKSIFEDKNNIKKLNEEQISIYNRNINLIDLSLTPIDIEIDIDKVVEKNKAMMISKIKKFFLEKKLRALLEIVDNNLL